MRTELKGGYLVEPVHDSINGPILGFVVWGPDGKEARIIRKNSPLGLRLFDLYNITLD